MLKIIGYTVKDDEVFIKVIDTEKPTIEPELVPLAKEHYNGLIQDGPPTTMKFYKDLNRKIESIIESRVMKIEKADEDLAKLNAIVQKVREDILNGTTNDAFGIEKAKLILATVKDEKIAIKERRHLIKALYQEEAKVKSKLIELGNK